jgi:hypothetical protein
MINYHETHSSRELAYYQLPFSVFKLTTDRRRPRHVGMIPRQPHEPAAVRRQSGRREEIMTANQHPPGLAAWLVEVDGDDCVDRLPVARVIFTHADPALARAIDATIGLINGELSSD